MQLFPWTHINFTDDLIEYKCVCCNNIYQQKFDEKLKEPFLNTYNFLTMITSLFYCSEMDDWEKFKETPEKEGFYSHLNMENITDVDYVHAKRVCKDFEIKTFRRKSWFLCSKWYIIVSWCIWKV